MLIRTLAAATLILASLTGSATGKNPFSKEKTVEASPNTTTGRRYTFQLDNKLNSNRVVDSVLVILDKFDHSGAGIVKKVYYPTANNEVIIDNLPEGKYFADVFVLGLDSKHFSSIIYTARTDRKNKLTLALDFKDTYVPGNVVIPAEDKAMFAFTH